MSIEVTTSDRDAVNTEESDLATKEADEQSEPQKDEEGESSEEQIEESETSDQESDDDSEDSEEDEDSEDEKPSKSKKSRGGFKRRIDKLSKQRAQAEQERDYYREQWLKTQQQEGKSQSEEPKRQQSQDSEKPKADDFDDHDSYLEALADYKADQKFKSWETKQKEEKLRQEQAAQTQSFQSKVQEFAKEHDDFQEVIEEVGDIPMSATVQHVILDSDNGPALMYALAQDPEQYEAICKMPAIQAARALGKIEASLSKESPKTEKPKPKLTKAPKPVSPVNSGSKGSIGKSYEDMTYEEYKAARLKEMRESRR